MQLFGSHTSPFVRHCRIALAQHNCDYEFVTVDYQRSAVDSPMQKMPYLKQDTLLLTDSSTIIKFIREPESAFLADLHQFEYYTQTNTLLDAAINLFLLEKHKVLPANCPYLQRQLQRVQSGLTALNQSQTHGFDPFRDDHLRLLCFLEWAQFRKRVDLNPFATLLAFIDQAQQHALITSTHPSLPLSE